MPRVVRRQPFLQRLGSFLNPLDHLLRLATDYEAFDWDNWQNTWGTPLGILLNVFCLISRGQADKFRRAGVDDVFRQQSGSSGMTAGLSYFVCDAAAPGGEVDLLACKPLGPAPESGFFGSLFPAVGQQLLYSSYALVAFSLANFVYCFSKKKYYRLFEFNVEVGFRP